MKLIKSKEFYDNNRNKITELLVNWSRFTYTNSQAAELAGYKEENWHRIGPTAHVTHIEYLASDYDRYQQNFDQICSHLNQDNAVQYPIIKTKQDLLDFYAKEVKQDGSKTLLDSVIWFVACWTAESFIELGTKHLAHILLNGVKFIDEDDIQGFIDEIIQNNEDERVANLYIVLNIFQHVGDERVDQVQEQIDQLEEEE